MFKFKTFATATIIAGSLFLPFSAVSAQTLRDTVQNRVDTYIENRCDRVTANIDNRIARYDDNKERHITRYNEIKDRVQQTVTKLDSEGLDTSKLKTDLQSLDSQIKDFANTYTNFIDILRSAKTYACGNSEGQFKDTVEQARAQLVVARDKATDIITFVKTTLKQDLQDIKSQIKK